MLDLTPCYKEQHSILVVFVLIDLWCVSTAGPTVSRKYTNKKPSRGLWVRPTELARKARSKPL